MRHLKVVATAVAVFLCIAIAPMAHAEVLICKVEKNRNTGGWIPLHAMFEFDRDSPAASLTFQTKDGPRRIKGEAVTLNTKRVTMVFKIDGMRNASNQYLTRMVYRSTFYFGKKTLKVTAEPLGYANRFQGYGACETK